MARKTKEQLEKQSFESLIQRLEEVVSRLESGGLSLEESLAAFEEGVSLVRAGESRLAEAEKKVEILTASPDGTVSAEPVFLDAADAAADSEGGTSNG